LPDGTDSTHAPELTSWVASANQPGAPFPIQNLPYATFRRNGSQEEHAGTAIGDQVLDLTEALGIASLQALMAMPADGRAQLRQRISGFLASRTPGADRFLSPLTAVQLLLPCPIGDYTDFYASIHHATNVGSMLRPENPLLPNYKWLPVGYHGRSSSLVASGTPVRRPKGQTREAANDPPVFGPSRRLDYEAEVGFFIGPGNCLGEPVPIGRAEEPIFGLCLVNDWSARDLQTWEYQPLGPFLAKSFATTLSPWIVTLEALAPFRVAAAVRGEGDPRPLPHLFDDSDQLLGGVALTVEVWISSAQMRQRGLSPVRLSCGSMREMYWTMAQMLAHHTSGGCNLQPGDLLASGTISGPTKSERGCLLELTWRGTEPVALPTGEQRRFLEDGDEVTLRGYCQREGAVRIGFGECRGVVLPAL